MELGQHGTGSDNDCTIAYPVQTYHKLDLNNISFLSIYMRHTFENVCKNNELELKIIFLSKYMRYAFEMLMVKGQCIMSWPLHINSLAPGRFERNLRKVIFKLILMIAG